MIFSDHFKRIIKLLGLLVMTLVALYFWISHKIQGLRSNGIVAAVNLHRLAPSLPANDKEIIRYNENRHEVLVTTAKGTTRQYSRSPNVEILKDGTVKVDANAWGAEVRPFMGPGYSDTGRLYLGCDLFYYRQFDLGASFGWTANGDRPAFQPMLSVGWNFWSSTSLNVGANPAAFVLQQKPEIAVFLSVRL